jgi:hypothetical protein
MDDLAEFGLLGVLALPTLVMASWSWGRRFADWPVLCLATPFGALLSFRMGQFLRATALAPATIRCGLPFALPLVVVIWLGAWVLITGGGLVMWSATRRAGRRLLLWGTISYALACTFGGLFGRYGPG